MGDVNKKGVEVHDEDWKEMWKLMMDSELDTISRFSGRVLEEYAEGNLVHVSQIEDNSVINGYEAQGDFIQPRKD